MTAKIIPLQKEGRSGDMPGGSLRVEKSAGVVLITVDDQFELTLTPAEAKQVGEHLTLLAIALGEHAE